MELGSFRFILLVTCIHLHKSNHHNTGTEAGAKGEGIVNKLAVHPRHSIRLDLQKTRREVRH